MSLLSAQPHPRKWQLHTLIFYAFDLLHLNGKDLRFRPLLEQRAELKKLIARDTKGCRVGCILRGMCRTLIEGVGSKLTSSPYRSGGFLSADKC